MIFHICKLPRTIANSVFLKSRRNGQFHRHPCCHIILMLVLNNHYFTVPSIYKMIGVGVKEVNLLVFAANGGFAELGVFAGHLTAFTRGNNLIDVPVNPKIGFPGFTVMLGREEVVRQRRTLLVINLFRVRDGALGKVVVFLAIASPLKRLQILIWSVFQRDLVYFKERRGEVLINVIITRLIWILKHCGILEFAQQSTLLILVLY